MKNAHIIRIGENDYIYEKDENGNDIIKRFIEEYDMWLISKLTTDENSKLRRFKEILKNEFFSKMAAIH